MKRSALIALAIAAAIVAAPLAQNPAPAPANPRLEALKKEAVADVDSRAQFSQQMVDQIFSYGELGFQEVETNRYLIDMLKKNGFAVQEGVAGVPTAFVATWGSGKPVIALGLRHRRHPAGVAEARGRVSRAADRRRAGPRRRAQLRPGGQHHRRDRGEEDHGAREALRHHPHLARHG